MSRVVRSVLSVAMLVALLAGLLGASGAPAAGVGHRGRGPARTVFAPAAVTANPMPAGTGTRPPLFAGSRLLCHQHRGPPLAAADAPFRMQATALGQYLIYGVHGDFLGAGAVPTAKSGHRHRLAGQRDCGARLHPHQPRRRRPERGALHVGLAAVRSTRRASRRDRHAVYRRQPESTVLGTIDAHTHVTAFEFLGGDFHCGRPWHPFGIQFALPDCAPYEQGTNGPVESFLDYGLPAHPHDTVGWPTFQDWPSPTDSRRGGRLLHRDRAGLEGRAAGDGDPARRQRGAVPADDHAAQPVQRHGQRRIQAAGPARAPGLHRRPVRRAGQGLLPDRHQPVPGPAGDQLRASSRSSRGSRSRTCSTAASTSARPQCDRREGRRRPGRGPHARRLDLLPDPQVRQRLRRHEDGRRARSA